MLFLSFGFDFRRNCPAVAIVLAFMFLAKGPLVRRRPSLSLGKGGPVGLLGSIDVPRLLWGTCYSVITFWLSRLGGFRLFTH